MTEYEIRDYEGDTIGYIDDSAGDYLVSDSEYRTVGYIHDNGGGEYEIMDHNSVTIGFIQNSGEGECEILDSNREQVGSVENTSGEYEIYDQYDLKKGVISQCSLGAPFAGVFLLYKIPIACPMSSADIKAQYNAEYKRWRGVLEKKRAEWGSTKQWDVELKEEDITALRELEDNIEQSIFPYGKKNNYGYWFKHENGSVVEIHIYPANIDKNDKKFEPLAKLKNLKSLFLSKSYNYRIGGKILDFNSLEGLSSLETLYLLRTSVESEKCVTLTTIPNLKRLKIEASDKKSPATFLEHVLKITSLEELNLSENMLDFNTFANGIGNLKNLKKLNLAETKGLGKFPDQFQNLESLEELDITDSDITGTSRVNWPKWFSNMKSLKLVHGKKHQVEGSGYENVRIILEKNNPEVYPKKAKVKLSWKDKMKKGLQKAVEAATDSKSSKDKEKEWHESLPEPLKKGWSGV